MAGKTSLTPETAKVILDAIEAGNYKSTACALAGIHRDTLLGWNERAAKGEEPFASFVEQLVEAEARAESKLLEEIRGAQAAVVGVSGPEPWQARAWVMERRYPKRWAGRVRTAVVEELDALTARLQQRLDADTFAKVVHATREDAPGETDGTDRRH